MSTCFIIQPFDGGPYDKRYEDVYAPAVKKASLEPYRVDRDPSASIPIEQIEEGIRAASLCLADITEDNPNVWFELGFAIAERKDVVIVCSEQRTTAFPFDIQHRNIIKYKTESPRDFKDLEQKITMRIQALLEKQGTLDDLKASSPVADVEGLKQHEFVAIVSLAQNLSTPEDIVSTYIIRQDMEKAGFTKVATTLALAALLDKSLIRTEVVENEYDESYIAYALEKSGMDWLMKNQDLLVLRTQISEEPDVKNDDGLPF